MCFQEILASIQRKGAAGGSGETQTSSVLSLESDPIVREYASADEPVEATTPPSSEVTPPAESIPDVAVVVEMAPEPKPLERLRDPRRAPEPVQKSLSKLTAHAGLRAFTKPKAYHLRG